MRYSEENFPPLTEKEFRHFKKTLEDNIDLYSGDDALYLRQYIIWEMLRQNGKDCIGYRTSLTKWIMIKTIKKSCRPVSLSPMPFL